VLRSSVSPSDSWPVTTRLRNSAMTWSDSTIQFVDSEMPMCGRWQLRREIFVLRNRDLNHTPQVSLFFSNPLCSNVFSVKPHDWFAGWG
jgi:hypothetical protein